jgi:hypothetical protein
MRHAREQPQLIGPGRGDGTCCCLDPKAAGCSGCAWCASGGAGQCLQPGWCWYYKGCGTLVLQWVWYTGTVYGQGEYLDMVRQGWASSWRYLAAAHSTT